MHLEKLGPQMDHNGQGKTSIPPALAFDPYTKELYDYSQK